MTRYAAVSASKAIETPANGSARGIMPRDALSTGWPSAKGWPKAISLLAMPSKCTR